MIRIIFFSETTCGGGGGCRRPLILRVGGRGMSWRTRCMGRTGGRLQDSLYLHIYHSGFVKLNKRSAGFSHISDIQWDRLLLSCVSRMSNEGHVFVVACGSFHSPTLETLKANAAMMVTYLSMSSLYVPGKCLSVLARRGCTVSKIQFMNSQKWNSMASFPIPTFLCLWAIYIFPGPVCLFGCRKKSQIDPGNI
jgi:hypothetical protein